jgi:hypothetical protein
MEQQTLARREGRPAPRELKALTSLMIAIRGGSFELNAEQRDLYSDLIDEDRAQESLAEKRRNATDESLLFRGTLVDGNRDHPVPFDRAVIARFREYDWNSPARLPIFDALARRGVTRDILWEVGAFPPGSAKFKDGGYLNTLCIPFYDRSGVYVVGVKALGLHPSGRILKENQGESQAHLMDTAHIASRPDEWIVLTEGELDALMLRARGWCATSGSGGCGTWRPYMSEYFRDRCVVINYDSDSEGRAGAKRVQEALKGIAREVVVLDLYPENDGTDKSHKDATDFLIHDRHTDEEFAERVQLAINAQVQQPEEVAQ